MNNNKIQQQQATPARNYGYSLFETIRIENNKPLNLTAHYLRMQQSSSILEINFSISLASFKKQIENIVKQKNNITAWALRIQLDKLNQGSCLSYSTRPIKYTAEQYEKGVKLCIAQGIHDSQNLLLQHKTTNFLQNLLTLKQAEAKGFDEALWLNEKGNICEGCCCNIFIKSGDQLITPPIHDGLLAGTMRAKIIQEQKAIEKSIRLTDIKPTDKIYITNSLLKIMPVLKIYTKTA